VLLTKYQRSWDSSAGIRMGYRLDKACTMHMGRRERNIYKVLVKNPEDHLKDLYIKGMITLKGI
jgi:hypothetical protein